METVDLGGKIFMPKLTQCARCGGSHHKLEFQKLDRPVVEDNGTTQMTHWAPCPTNGQPILYGVRDLSVFKPATQEALT